MNFESELISGLFIKRYKRFFVDIKIKNQIIIAHCPNSGSMLNLLDKGNPVWITKSNNEKRKLKYSLQIIKSKGRKFGVNTHLANKIILEALQRKKIEELSKFDIIKPEQKFGTRTRFDFLLENTSLKKKAYLEVKSVTLNRSGDLAEFPDAVTTRGKKHLEDLAIAKIKGFESYIIYLVQIENCKQFNIAYDIDPQYFEAFKEAKKKDVKILCYNCKFNDKGIEINKKIKINE